jgi:XRE family transcriptional regulator, aerobic/anaerobic benzoate catabolism transcriptional regulator
VSAKPVIHPRAAGEVSARSQRGEALRQRVAERVKAVRARRGMTRRVLARDSNVSASYLARLEEGDCNISLQLLQQVADALAVPFVDLVRDPGADDVELTLIGQMLRRLPPKVLPAVRAHLAATYAEAVSDRMRRIALIGLRGAGKSTLGALLAKELRRPFIELDREIEKDTGLAVSEIFMLYGQGRFRQLERVTLERILGNEPEAVIATGGGIVSESASYEPLLATCFTVWLQATPDDHMNRVLEQRDYRITDNYLYDEAMENIRRVLSERDAQYRRADAILDTSGLSVTEGLARLKVLVSPAKTK